LLVLLLMMISGEIESVSLALSLTHSLTRISYSYSFYASRNILLVHKLKDGEKEQTVTAAWEHMIM
jgi:hypothetical protein